MQSKDPMEYAQEVPLSPKGDPDAEPRPTGTKRPGEEVHEE